MNYIVTEFEAVDEDYLIPKLHNKSTIRGGNEDVMELLWHNSQVVMQSQSQSQNQKSKKSETSAATRNEIKPAVVEDDQSGPSDLCMQEEEMASWLHYPVDDDNNTLLESYLNSDGILYPTPVSSTPVVAAAVASSLPPPPPPSVKIPSSQPPVPPYNRLEGESGQPKFTNFMHFSRASRGRDLERSQGCSSKVAPMLRPLTNVATSAVVTPESRSSRVSEKPRQLNVKRGEGASGIAVPGPSLNGRETETREISVTSSHGTGGLAESAGIEQSTQKSPVPTDDRKRKSRDTDDIGCHNEDVEFVYPDEKKQSHGGSTSMKRSRAAEVHNLSERKRRDRINEKMKALEDLIPRYNKSDKASMLDEAIEYLKSLQLQVQMMSMGCGMVPMMFPGVQQYVPLMAMGMGMGMGMDMGMNRTMVPYPAILPGSGVHNPAAMAAAATHLAQHFPVPEFNMSPVTAASPAASQMANMSAPMMTSFPLSTQNQPPVPNFADPFQQYLDLQQTQLQVPLSQGLGGMPPIATKPSSSNKDATNPDIHQTS